MVSAGITYALITGTCWSAIGIILSCCSRRKLDAVSYSLLHTVLAANACYLLYADPAKIEFNSGFYLLLLTILAAAVLNAFAQYLVKCAMDSGHYAPVWAMAQAAMIFPFLCGVLFWGNSLTAANLAGILLLLAGILLPCRKGFSRPGSWIKTALAALLCYGLLQTLYLIPSHVKELSDAGSLRPALACLGNFAGWSIIAGCRQKKLEFSRLIIVLAVIMMILHTISVKTFFLALDSFGRFGVGGIGVPFMLGVNLTVFGLYSLLFLKEKRTRENLIAELLIPAGLFCLCL